MWHFIATIYKPVWMCKKAHKLGRIINLGNNQQIKFRQALYTLSLHINSGPTEAKSPPLQIKFRQALHTLSLHTHRSNTHSFLQELLVFIFGLESQTFSIQDTSPLNQSEQGDHSGLGINRWIYFGLHFNFQRVETDYTHSKVNSEYILGIPYNQFSFLTF